MAKSLSVTKGHRIFIADTLADLLDSSKRIEIEEVQTTPDKSTEPEYVDAPAISLRQQRKIGGVPGAPDNITYQCNFDSTPVTGNYAVALGLIGTTGWIFEEYVDSGKDELLGDGYLYYGKIDSVGLPGQELNKLITFSINVSNLGDDNYYVTFTGDEPQTATYYSVLTGKVVTPTEPNLES